MQIFIDRLRFILSDAIDRLALRLFKIGDWVEPCGRDIFFDDQNGQRWIDMDKVEERKLRRKRAGLEW